MKPFYKCYANGEIWIGSGPCSIRRAPTSESHDRTYDARLCKEFVHFQFLSFLVSFSSNDPWARTSQLTLLDLARNERECI